MARLLFFYFASVSVISAFLVISLRNIVYSALALLVTLLHVAGLYILLGAELLAALQVIVYAGAILVLYLFVLMLFHQKERDLPFHRQAPVAIGLALVIILELGLALFDFRSAGLPVEAPVASVAQAANTETLGLALYTVYYFPFEVASLILLAAMVGAIVLAKPDLR